MQLSVALSMQRGELERKSSWPLPQALDWYRGPGSVGAQGAVGAPRSPPPPPSGACKGTERSGWIHPDVVLALFTFFAVP